MFRFSSLRSSSGPVNLETLVQHLVRRNGALVPSGPSEGILPPRHRRRSLSGTRSLTEFRHFCFDVVTHHSGAPINGGCCITSFAEGVTNIELYV
jgi:hypothetical protein